MKARTMFCALLLVVSPSLAAAGNKASDVKINSGPAGTCYNGGLVTCDNNGTVYAVYNSSRNASDPTQEANALEVYFNISTDHGTTWSTDRRIDTGPGVLGIPDRLRIWSPFIGCDDTGHLYGGWMDGRDFGNPARPNHGTGWWEDGRCTRTTDFGATWLASDVRVNSWNGNYPRCAMPISANDQNGNVYVAWYSTKDQPLNYNEIFFGHSTDHGATWADDIRIDTAPPSASEWYPQVRCDASGHVYVLWESSGRRQVRFNRSSDHGATWQGADIRVDTDYASGMPKTSVALACDENGNVYAAWKDLRDGGGSGAGSIYMNRSTDHGETWGASDIRVDAMGNPPDEGPEYGPQIACTGDGTVYVVWEDKRYGGEWDIFFNRSTDHGNTWEAGNARLDTDAPGAYRSFRPQLARDGGNGVYVVWEDWREGYHHIYMNYSLDRGDTWLVSDLRVDVDSAPAHAEWPRLCVDDFGTVYMAWGYRETVWPGDCADIHFAHYAPGTLPVPGACCWGASCGMRTGQACQESGGVFQGGGTICTADLCLTSDAQPGPSESGDGLLGAAPNPFATSSILWFRLSEPAFVRLDIVDAAGRRIRLIQEGEMGAGAHSVSWDGQGSAGDDVPSGAYFVRLKIADETWTRALIRLR